MNGKTVFYFLFTSKKLDYKKILIYRIGHLGDTLVSLPSFWAIRENFPDAHLTLLTNIDAQNAGYIAAQSVLPKTGLFDEWLFYPNNLPKIKIVPAFLKLLREIRRQNFDCLFYLMTRNRSVGQIERDRRFFRLAGIKKIFGADYLLKNLIGDARTMRKPLPIVESETDFFLDTLAADGFRIDKNIKPEMLLGDAEKDFANQWLAKNCGDAFGENRLIAIAPGSKWDSKIWAEERFAEVVAELIKRNDVFPIVFGGGEDREKGNRLLNYWKTGANAAGQLNIRQAAAALEKCRLYLGNDTGTMHLAASVNVRCVAVFAAIDLPGRWHPYGDNHTIFRTVVPCEGCHAPICPFEKQCTTAIEAASVFAACERILEQSNSD